MWNAIAVAAFKVSLLEERRKKPYVGVSKPCCGHRFEEIRWYQRGMWHRSRRPKGWDQTGHYEIMAGGEGSMETSYSYVGVGLDASMLLAHVGWDTGREKLKAGTRVPWAWDGGRMLSSTSMLFCVAVLST